MGVARLTQMLLLAALLQLHHVDAYSKYGRGCSDIGCLPSEECIITSDSCSYNQRDGKDCGNYPTCKRKTSSGNTQANPSSSSSSVNPSGSSLNTGPENNIFAPASSNPTLNTFTYFNHNNNPNNNNNHNNNNMGHQGSQSAQNQGGSMLNGNQGSNGDNNNNGNNNNKGMSNTNGAAGASATGIIDPHYVFGSKQHTQIIPNMPIFPYNSPTQAPSFQQFPQPNHPGSVVNPGYPMRSLQPVNPYNPPFVFGQSPSGTGLPPGNIGGGGGGGVGGGASSSMAVLGGGGGGLAPYGSNYQGYQTHHQNANMYNKPPPQYQNQNQQNPYNRQTQAHPSAATRFTAGLPSLCLCTLSALLLLCLNRRGSST